MCFCTLLIWWMAVIFIVAIVLTWGHNWPQTSGRENGTRGWKTTILKHVAFMSAVLLPFWIQHYWENLADFNAFYFYLHLTYFDVGTLQFSSHTESWLVNSDFKWIGLMHGWANCRQFFLFRSQVTNKTADTVNKLSIMTEIWWPESVTMKPVTMKSVTMKSVAMKFNGKFGNLNKLD